MVLVYECYLLLKINGSIRHQPKHIKCQKFLCIEITSNTFCIGVLDSVVYVHSEKNALLWMYAVVYVHKEQNVLLWMYAVVYVHKEQNVLLWMYAVVYVHDEQNVLLWL